MANCPKCGRVKIQKPKVGRVACKRCGPVLRTILPAQYAMASLSERPGQ
jgi:uncharacterized Zn finger protein (UPF0148 family)